MDPAIYLDDAAEAEQADKPVVRWKFKKNEAEKADADLKLYRKDAAVENAFAAEAERMGPDPFGAPAAAPLADAFGQRRLNAVASSTTTIGGVLAYREYAHPVRADRLPNDRIDFAETLYWNAAVKTDDKGEATVTFDLSDSVTSFRAMADVYTITGSFGAEDRLIESRRPFYTEIKTPLGATVGDQALVPIVVVNETDESMEAAVVVEAPEGITLGKYPETVTLPAHSRQRVLVPASMNSTSTAGSAWNVSAGAGEYMDTVSRTIPVSAFGFPVTLSEGGVLAPGKTARHEFTVPASVIDKTITGRAEVYPTPLANMTSALESLIRDPYGCFEQTSSTTYPLVMAMQYFQSHQGVDPALIAKTRDKLDAGYTRLVGFETKSQGYEWFGAAPAHEALTAYGCLEFADMAAVHPVDPQMVKRTSEWLMARRDGKGGFLRDPKAIDSFGRAPEAITNAYITHALLRCGTPPTDLKAELDQLLKQAASSEDPYFLALVSLAAQDAGRKDEAAGFLRKLATRQDKSGVVSGAETTITGSGGSSLDIETTSLAVLAWLNEPAYAANVEKAMKWVCGECEGGRFGSTQSTVLALKAIIAYDKQRAVPQADGKIILRHNGIRIAEIPFTKDQKEPLAFPQIASLLTPGPNVVELTMEGGSQMPYSLMAEYLAATPSSTNCPVELETVLNAATVREGEPAEIVATVKNLTDKGQPMTLAVVGIPAGLEPRIDRLKELVDGKVIDFYELNGRELALYWRDMAPSESIRVPISLTAEIPGTYTAPASRAFLYYTPEERQWIAGNTVTIEPRK